MHRVTQGSGLGPTPVVLSDNFAWALALNVFSLALDAFSLFFYSEATGSLFPQSSRAECAII